tara:strand:+ start:498 stop:632 length:135 start_codon:yes stop_codon:yes gene_type:complete
MVKKLSAILVVLALLVIAGCSATAGGGKVKYHIPELIVIDGKKR